MTVGQALVRIEGLKVHYAPRAGSRASRGKPVRAVDGFDLEILQGETVALVGESGCGKSTAGRAALRLVEPTSGTVWFRGIDVTSARRSDLVALRREMQMIFQDPFSSLDPRMSVERLIRQPLSVHGLVPRRHRRARVLELLELVGLPPRSIDRYPHEFSGGQRQRIGIARALATEPSFIVCDEPISALDVSIQAQIVNLFEDLQAELGLTYLFIAHDLSIVRHIAHRVAVMYLGCMVEVTDATSLYDRPLHPYTQALLSAVPVPDPVAESRREPILLEGDLPDPSDPPVGCSFSTRCRFVEDHCRVVSPQLEEVEPGRWVACHLWQQIELSGGLKSENASQS